MRPPRYHVLTQEPLPAATGGYDENGAGVVIPNDRGLQLKNMLPGRSGRVVMRGPLVNGKAVMTTTQYASPGPDAHTGLTTFDDKILMDGGGGLVVTDLAALTVTALGSGIAHFPGTRYARVDAFVYSIPDGGAAAAGRRPAGTGGTGSTTSLFKWDGTSVIGGISALTSAGAPGGAIIDVASHLSRLFALGGTVPGTSTPYYQDRIYWSDIGGPVSNTLSLWQDDVTGLVNQISLDGGAANYGVGLAKIGNGLLVLRRQTLDLLSGLTPANFSIRPVASIGCRSTLSIVPYNNGVFFMSDDGFTWFDGVAARQVSDPVQPSLMAAARADNAQVRASMIGTDSVMVNVVDTGVYPETTRWSGIYHAPSGSWMEFSSNALIGLRPVWSGRTANFPFVTDQRVIYDASFVTQPTAATASLRGTETVPDTAIKSIIPAEMKTRVASLGLPMRTATLNRAYPQYILRTDVASNAGWAFTVEDSVGNVLVPSVTLPPQTNPANPPQRQVGSLEALPETVEAVFHFTYQSSSLRAAYDAELHDSYVEFSFAEDKPS